MINLYQGETKYIEVTYVDTDDLPVNLNGAEAIFSYQQGTGTITKKACTIQDNVITAKLTAEETDEMLGRYNYEIRVKDSNSDIDCVVHDMFNVQKAVLPVYSLT